MFRHLFLGPENNNRVTHIAQRIFLTGGAMLGLLFGAISASQIYTAPVTPRAEQQLSERHFQLRPFQGKMPTSALTHFGARDEI